MSVLSTVIPSLILPGNALRTARRSVALSISSDAFVTSCDGRTTRAGLSYQWNVRRNGVLDLSLVSRSKDPSRLLLPAYSLTVGAVYDVALTVTITESLQSASAGIQVVVEEGAIVAVVAGGSSRTMRVEERLLLDATPSYDEDQVGVTGTTAGLQFAWSCAQIFPMFITNCDAVFNSTDTTDSVFDSAFLLSALPGAADTVVEIRLTLVDSSLSRAAEASVSISVLPALAPVVSLVSNIGANAVMNADKPLQLAGTVSLPAGYGGDATWSVNEDSGVALSQVARSPLERSFVATQTVSQNTLYMAVAANSLPAGSTLIFALTAQIPTIDGTPQAVSTVTVRVNSPPLPGTFFVTPDTGMELDDRFEFVASSWTDPDLDLR